MTALGSTAFRLALRRVAIFPLAPGTKIPLAGTHGCRDASDDADAARARWQRRPSANIGIATGARSMIWVLDIDAHHGGNESLARLEAEHGPLPATITTGTPNGGRHLYWRWPASGPEIRNSAGRIAPGLDVRGEGGSVVAPPSVLADGRRYRWLKTGAHGFAEAPAWIVSLALPPPAPPRPKPRPLEGDVSAYVAAAVADELKALDAAASGGRNETLNRVAYVLAQFVKADALPDDWAHDQLEARAIAIGLSATEARCTIASAFRAAQPRDIPT